MKNILIIAAENSAEYYGAKIIKRFSESSHNVSFFGIGGERFRENNVELIIHNKELSIVGIIEVISSILKFKKIMSKIVKEAKNRSADAAILIDFPDFNLRLAKKMKQSGIPVYFYISPTVWAWRYSRIKTIKKFVDHMFLIFPFEKKIYDKEKIPFTYTGHPLVPEIKHSVSKKVFRSKIGVKENEKILVLLPGSRESEIKTLLPVMIETVKTLKLKLDFKPFILKAENIKDELIKTILKNHSEENIETIDQKVRYDLFNASDAALTSCGTSNLELAVSLLPFVAVYKVNPISYFLGKNFLNISLFSIVNILLKKSVVEEYIQKNFTSENCAGGINRILTNQMIVKKQESEFKKLKKMLSNKTSPSSIIFNKLENLIFKNN